MGVLREFPDKRITEIGVPQGVVAAICPTTWRSEPLIRISVWLGVSTLMPLGTASLTTLAKPTSRESTAAQLVAARSPLRRLRASMPAPKATAAMPRPPKRRTSPSGRRTPVRCLPPLARW